MVRVFDPKKHPEKATHRPDIIIRSREARGVTADAIDVTKVLATAKLPKGTPIAKAPLAGAVATRSEEEKTKHYVANYVISPSSAIGFGVQQDGSCGKAAHSLIRRLAVEAAKRPGSSLPTTVMLRLFRERIAVAHIRGLALFIPTCVHQWRLARAKRREELQREAQRLRWSGESDAGSEASE